MAYITVNVEFSSTMKGTYIVHVVTSSEELPYKVFAIEVLPKSRDNKTAEYRFSHICSMSELEEFPTDEPDEVHCYFRTNDITMVFDTANTANLVVKAIREDVKRLEAEYIAVYELITGGTITPPDPPPTPGPDDPSLIPNIYYEDL